MAVVETRPQVDTHWLPGIEALRAIAALAVMVHHLYDLGDGRAIYGRTLIEGLGEWGVDIFFLLSAFLLCEYFWHERERRPLRAFYVRRGLRIGPAYYACVVVLFLFFADRTLLFTRFGFHQVLANVTFTHWLWPSTSSSLNVDGALWTLTIEMLLYAAMPLMALAFWRRPWWTLVTLCVAGVAFRVVVAVHGGGLQSWWFTGTGPAVAIQRLFIGRQFVGFLPVFAVGMAVRWLVVRRRLPGWATRPLVRPSVVVLVALMLPSVVLLVDVYRASDYHHWVHYALFDIGIAALAAPLLIYAARPAAGRGTPVMRALVWLGKRSYGLYLWHFPVILTVYQRGPQMLPAHLDHLWLRVAAVVVISVGLAAASYHLVEQPAMAYARRRTRPWLERGRAAGDAPGAVVAR